MRSMAPKAKGKVVDKNKLAKSQKVRCSIQLINNVPPVAIAMPFNHVMELPCLD